MNKMSPLSLNFRASSGNSTAAARPLSPVSPELENQHDSFQALNGATSLSPLESTSTPARRVRDRQAESPGDDGGRETRRRKGSGARHVPRDGAAQTGPARSASASVSASSSVLQDRYRTVPSGISFLISAHDLAALQVASSRPLEISSTFASSDGSSMVKFVDAPVAPPVALPQAEPAPAAEQPASEEAYAAFDPINSLWDDKLGAQLARMLERGSSDESIYKQVLRPKGTLKNHLLQNRWAFTPELLVVVLRTLSTLDSNADIQRLGHAFGRLRVFSERRGSDGFVGSGTLGRPARRVIGDALGHRAIQADVPLCRLLKFLEAANETCKPTSVKRDGRFVNGDPRTQFTSAGASYGIPQALAQRLVREATGAAGGDLTDVLASAKQLGEVLAKGSSYRGTETQDAVLNEIQRSGLAQALKAQLKSQFKLGFAFGPDESSDAASESA